MKLSAMLKKLRRRLGRKSGEIERGLGRAFETPTYIPAAGKEKRVVKVVFMGEESKFIATPKPIKKPDAPENL